MKYSLVISWSASSKYMKWRWWWWWRWRWWWLIRKSINVDKPEFRLVETSVDHCDIHLIQKHFLLRFKASLSSPTPFRQSQSSHSFFVYQLKQVNLRPRQLKKKIQLLVDWVTVRWSSTKQAEISHSYWKINESDTIKKKTALWCIWRNMWFWTTKYPHPPNPPNPRYIITLKSKLKRVSLLFKWPKNKVKNNIPITAPHLMAGTCSQTFLSNASHLLPLALPYRTPRVIVLTAPISRHDNVTCRLRIREGLQCLFFCWAERPLGCIYSVFTSFCLLSCDGNNRGVCKYIVYSKQ